jgi:hypothetical protein
MVIQAELRYSTLIPALTLSFLHVWWVAAQQQDEQFPHSFGNLQSAQDVSVHPQDGHAIGPNTNGETMTGVARRRI